MIMLALYLLAFLFLVVAGGSVVMWIVGLIYIVSHKLGLTK